jgi:hypothetical protein
MCTMTRDLYKCGYYTDATAAQYCNPQCRPGLYKHQVVRKRGKCANCANKKPCLLPAGARKIFTTDETKFIVEK